MELENEIGAPLPEDYREFLLRENGGVPKEKAGHWDFKVFFGIYNGSNNLSLNWRETRGHLPQNMLPIGQTLNEDHVLLNLEDGSIHSDGEQISSSFTQFVSDHFTPFESTSLPVELIDDHRFQELQELLDSGALDINAEARPGKTLIQYSAWLGKDDAVRFLAERGADPKGCLHAMLESGFGHLQIIKCLLSHGADIHERNAAGKRVVDIDSPWTRHIIEQAGGQQ